MKKSDDDDRTSAKIYQFKRPNKPIEKKKGRKAKKTAKKPDVRKRLKKEKEIQREIAELEREVRKLLDGYEGAIKTHSGRAIALGKCFIRLKAKQRRLRVVWETYLKEKWAFVSLRSVQRWTLIARYADIDEYPAIGYLAVYKLEELISCLIKKDLGKKKIGKVLLEYEIDPSLVEDKHDSISKFKLEVDDLIQSLRAIGGWRDAEQSDYVNPYAANELAKLNSKAKRRHKKNLRKQGKIEKEEMERSIQRCIATLIRHLDTALHKQHKIVGDLKIPFSISVTALKQLKDIINNFLLLIDKNEIVLRDPDIPDEYDDEF